MAQKGILLESGTNEIEVMEFFLGSQNFGINVLKVQRVLRHSESDVTPVPGAHPSIGGSFRFLGNSTPMVNLNRHLGIPSEDEENDRKIIIVCEFNNAIHGFLSDGITKIHRASWEDIQPLTSNTESFSAQATGIARIDDHEIVMLDLENIVDEIFGSTNDPVDDPLKERNDVAAMEELRRQAKVAIVDDSQMIRHLLQDHLQKHHYQHLKLFNNGAEAYEYCMELKAEAERDGRPITDYLDIVVSDIEMSQMDGLTLCRYLKQEIPQVTVIIVSSMITTQMSNKCQEVAADAYISKKNIGKMLELMDQALRNQ